MAKVLFESTNNIIVKLWFVINDDRYHHSVDELRIVKKFNNILFFAIDFLFVFCLAVGCWLCSWWMLCFNSFAHAMQSILFTYILHRKRPVFRHWFLHFQSVGDGWRYVKIFAMKRTHRLPKDELTTVNKNKSINRKACKWNREDDRQFIIRHSVSFSHSIFIFFSRFVVNTAIL